MLKIIYSSNYEGMSLPEINFEIFGRDDYLDGSDFRKIFPTLKLEEGIKQQIVGNYWVACGMIWGEVADICMWPAQYEIKRNEGCVEYECDDICPVYLYDGSFKRAFGFDPIPDSLWDVTFHKNGNITMQRIVIPLRSSEHPEGIYTNEDLKLLGEL